jgi:short-subunit dehydrogenase
VVSPLSIVIGAGSGLGKALAIKLSARGHSLLLVGRTAEKLETTKALCHGEIGIFAGDISIQDKARAAFDAALQLNASLTNVFCCAGDPGFAPIGKISDRDVDRAFNGNLIATVFCTQEAIRAFRQTNVAGHLVLVLSTAAQVAREKEPLYTAAKWGARGFFLSVREALKGDRIQITAVYPGGMKTEFWKRDEHLLPKTDGFLAPETVAEVILQNVLEATQASVSEIVINRRS